MPMVLAARGQEEPPPTNQRQSDMTLRDIDSQYSAREKYGSNHSSKGQRERFDSNHSSRGRERFQSSESFASGGSPTPSKGHARLAMRPSADERPSVLTRGLSSDMTGHAKFSSGSPSGVTPRSGGGSRRVSTLGSKVGPSTPSRGKSFMNTAYIARPDGKSFLESMARSKTGKLSSSDLSREVSKISDDKDIRESAAEYKWRHAQTSSGDTDITVKEEALEQIMSAEAYAGFEQMGRHQLNRNLVTRVAIDQNMLPENVEVAKIFKNLEPSDLEEELTDSDDDFMSEYGFHQNAGQPGDDIDELVGNLEGAEGIKVGFAMPEGSYSFDGMESTNMDRVFSARCGDYLMFGVINAHGNKTEASKLAQHIADELPRAVFRSQRLTKCKDPAQALVTGFKRVHHSGSNALDLKLTGASVTCLLIDAHVVWIASVGDCRACLATADHRANAAAYHFTASKLTKDHVLGVKEEFDRVMAWGGEMRKLVNDQTYRVYLKDTDLPGAVLTRAIGDRIGHAVGVCHVPAISAVRRVDIPQGSFITLASGGVWATMSESMVVNWVSSYFSDMSEAANSLGQEALRRWEDKHCPAKQCLSRDEVDCFSVIMVSFDKKDWSNESAEPDVDTTISRAGQAILTQRPFSVGPQRYYRQRPWEEVKTSARVMRMRHTQGRDRPGQTEMRDGVWTPDNMLGHETPMHSGLSRTR